MQVHPEGFVAHHKPDQAIRDLIRQKAFHLFAQPDHPHRLPAYFHTLVHLLYFPECVELPLLDVPYAEQNCE